MGGDAGLQLTGAGQDRIPLEQRITPGGLDAGEEGVQVAADLLACVLELVLGGVESQSVALEVAAVVVTVEPGDGDAQGEEALGSASRGGFMPCLDAQRDVGPGGTPGNLDGRTRHADVGVAAADARFDGLGTTHQGRGEGEGGADRSEGVGFVRAGLDAPQQATDGDEGVLVQGGLVRPVGPAAVELVAETQRQGGGFRARGHAGLGDGGLRGEPADVVADAFEDDAAGGGVQEGEDEVASQLGHAGLLARLGGLGGGVGQLARGLFLAQQGKALGDPIGHVALLGGHEGFAIDGPGDLDLRVRPRAR